MSDKAVQAKLNALAVLANELHEEAQRRYGTTGNLFFEAEGTFYFMAGDADEGVKERQEFIRFSSKGYCHMGGGAW